jgi:hypothetical protein
MGHDSRSEYSGREVRAGFRERRGAKAPRFSLTEVVKYHGVAPLVIRHGNFFEK